MQYCQILTSTVEWLEGKFKCASSSEYVPTGRHAHVLGRHLTRATLRQYL